MQASKDSAYEMLSITKNINYIGKIDNQGNLVMKPTILIKEGLLVAVYGIGYIKDTILISMLTQGMYTIEPIPEDLRRKYSVFKILLFHQNRFKGDVKGAPNSIKYHMLPDGFDLVIWGHEHDCFTSLIKSTNPECNIYQPGSSVITSFTDGEALAKHCGVVHVRADGSFLMEYCKLQTARFLLVRELEYSVFWEVDHDHSHQTMTETYVQGLLKNYIEKMIAEADQGSIRA